MQEIDLARYPKVKDWLARVGARPAVQRGRQIPPRDDGL
jgi:glutathione S-transferase